MSTAVPLLPIFLAYHGLAAVDLESADAMRGGLEQLLSDGEIDTADDLFAKARYIQDTGKIDPSLIPMEAIDTLVVGIVRLLGSALSTPPLSAAA